LEKVENFDLIISKLSQLVGTQ